MMGEILSENHLWLLLLMQGTACIALGLTGSFLLKRHASRAHQILLIALLASVLMPASYVCVKHFGLGVLVAEVPVAPEASLDLQPVDAIVLIETPKMEVESAEVIAEIEEAVSLPSVYRAKSVPVPWRAILFVGWAVTSATLLARLAFRFALSAYLLRNAQPVDAAHMRQALNEGKRRLGIAGPVDICASDKVRSPVIWCWSRTPTLLVHTDAIEGVCRRDWVGVFCHELAHLKRLDHLAGLFAELLICLAPWHPLLWWARKQLLRFSEEACDDWVLAGGQIGVDYAESLLELSPQPELAFVPTVVGKEKTMKARIHRIVKDQCSNPRIGKRWALMVCAATVCLGMGVAFAQRRPVERPQAERQELREREERQHELMVAGRRNVLERLLDQLVAQMHETEATLRERGDNPGADGQVMRAELDTLREHIGIVERQLGDLEQREQPRPESDEPRSRRQQIREMEAHGEELARHRDELAERAGRMEIELRELKEAPPEARERAELELREIHEQIEAVDREQANLEQARARTEPQRVDVERVRTQSTRERAPADGERMRDLNQHLRELQTRTREVELRLDRIDDKDSSEARELQGHLDTTREEMMRVEQDLQQLRRQRAASARARSDGRPVTQGRQTPRDVENRESRLRQAHEGLMAQIRLTEEKLKNAREQDSPGAERLQRVLEQLHERRESLEREAGALNDAPRDRPRDNPDMERQVEELRGKVDGMHEEMAQMREMLQQLLERGRVEKEEIQEMKQY